MLSLEQMIQRVNPYAELYVNYKNQIEELERQQPEGHVVSLSMHIHRVADVNRARGDYTERRYNANIAGGQIGAIFTENEGFPTDVFVCIFMYFLE